MKIMKQMALFALGLSIVACSNTVGNNVVNDKGQLENKTADWPKLDDASRPEGIFPNLNNLNSITKAMTKKELYNLIQEPHFSEMNGADEWNYIMKFRNPDGSVKICQYKVLFDDEELAQSFFWKPSNCLGKAVKKKEKFDISADALFPFDKGGVKDIKPEGKAKLDKLADRLLKEVNGVKLHLVGYTDYKGTEDYNMSLSEKRAKSVKAYLVSKGLKAEDITSDWKGESNPVKSCSTKLGKKALIDCLQPNRRVNVEVTYYKLK